MTTDLEGAVAAIWSLRVAEQTKAIEALLVALCDKIEAQETALARITRERDEALTALRPFAEEAKGWATTDRAFVPKIADTGVWASTPAKYTVGDLRRAAALVNGEGE